MTEVNIDLARYNMVEQQIRPWDVLDQTVLDVIAATPRERFVPTAYANVAFSDVEIPLGHGEVMMTPKLEARILQTLALQPSDTVLEIGTGSGYLTACLAKLAAEVVTVEIIPEFSQQAQQRVAGQGLTNVEFKLGDAARGWYNQDPLDAIVLTGSLPQYHDAFQESLKVGGRLFVIIGQAPAMEARLITRVSETEWQTESLFETVIPPLRNAALETRFAF